MDTNQTAPTPNYAPASAAPGLLGSKIPSAAAFLVAALLFLMPFVDIRCNGTSLKTFSGVQLATGFKPPTDKANSGLLDDIQEKSVDVTSKATDKTETNLFILVALIAGGVGFLLSLTNSKALIGVAIVVGLAGAGSLIAGMMDIKKKAKIDMPNLKDKTPDNDVGRTMDDIGDKMSDLGDNVKITVDFTPWFYIAVVAFLAAAFLCYRRMSVGR